MMVAELDKALDILFDETEMNSVDKMLNTVPDEEKKMKIIYQKWRSLTTRKQKPLMIW